MSRLRTVLYSFQAANLRKLHGSRNFDVTVVGGGIVGACAAYFAAARGLKVALLEERPFLHRFGSSHGESRVIRPTYSDDFYTKLMPLSYSLWNAAEEASGSKVFTRTSGLDFGPPHGGMRTLLRAAELHNVCAQELSFDEATSRYPGLKLQEDWVVLSTHDAGVLHATKSVSLFHNLARSKGAILRDQTKICRVRLEQNGVAMEVENGETLYTNKVILAMGSWMPSLLCEWFNVEVKLRPIAMTSYYWHVDSCVRDRFSATKFPVFLYYGDDILVYSTPCLEYRDLIKVNLHAPVAHFSGGPGKKPSVEVATQVLGPWIRKHMTGIRFEKPVLVESCWYTMSKDGGFIIDWLPGWEGRVVVASCCSGHGFKLGPVSGKLASDFAIDGGSDKSDMSNFSFRGLVV